MKLTWLKLIITGILLSILFSKANLEDFVLALNQVALPYLGLAIVSFLGIEFCETWRLGTALSIYRLPIQDLVKLSLIGQFYANLLPGQFGADIYRITELKRLDGSILRPTALLLLLRLLGFAVLIGASGLYAVFASQYFVLIFKQVNIGLPVAPWLSIVIVLTATIAILGFFLKQQVIKGILNKLETALRSVAFNHIISIIVISLFVLLGRLMSLHWLVLGMGYNLTLAKSLFVVLNATLITLLPVSIAGLGVREGAIAFGFQLFGIPAEAGLAIAVINRLMLWSLSLLGGLLFLINRNGIHAKSEADCP